MLILKVTPNVISTDVWGFFVTCHHSASGAGITSENPLLLPTAKKQSCVIDSEVVMNRNLCVDKSGFRIARKPFLLLDKSLAL